MVRTFFLYVLIVLGGTLIGAIVSGVVGLLLGLLLARTYVKHSPSDPAHAPAYVGIGFVLLGVVAGAVLGFISSLTICISLASRKNTATDYQLPTPL